MIATDLFSKNKDKIINVGVILVALVAALYLFNMQNQQMVSLEESKNEEMKKSEVIESLGRVEKRIETYKKVFTGKDLGSVIDAMTDIAKDTKVNVISVKPGIEQRQPDYVKSSFLIVIRAADYHALGNFISKLENYKDLFLVEELNITSLSGQQDKKSDQGLDISLKISTVTCL